MSKYWATPTWYFFHSLAEQVNEEDFPKLKNDLFNIFKNICSCLPCYECTNHAKQYIRHIRFQKINTKEDFKKMLFDFHNNVNVRLRKPIFNNYNMYKSSKLKSIFLNFKYNYLRNNGLNRGFTDSLYRKNIINHIESFFNKHRDSFTWI